MHNLFGFYPLPLLLLVVLTGATFFYWESVEGALYRLTGAPRPRSTQAATAGTALLTIDSLLDRADRAAPGTRTACIDLPAGTGKPLPLARVYPGSERNNHTADVTIDPVTGAVLEVKNSW